MKRKKILLFVLLPLLLGALVLASFSRHTVERKITLPYGHTRVMEQLSEMQQVAQWYLPFAGKAATKVTEQELVLESDKAVITTSSALAVAMNITHEGNSKIFYFKALPDTVHRNHTEVTLVYKSSLFGKWFGGGSLEKNALSSLANLKRWMEDTRSFYGYAIEEIKVTDTSFLFATKVVPAAGLKSGSEALFGSLIAFAAEKQLSYTGTRIFNTRKISETETELYASIGISKNIFTKPDDAFHFKAMPGGKNLLIARYEGPLKDIQKAYDALDNYRRDRGLLSMAMPFCKIMQEGTGFADDERVTLNVTLPVY